MFSSGRFSRLLCAGVFFRALHDAQKVKVMEMLAEKLAGNSAGGSRGTSPLLARRDAAAAGSNSSEQRDALQPSLVCALVSMADDYHTFHLLPTTARPVRFVPLLSSLLLTSRQLAVISNYSSLMHCTVH